MADNLRRVEEKAEESLKSGGGHALAIGFYIAALVLIIGTALVLYGLLGPAAQEYKALGININLWWGLFMVLFGCVVLGMSFASPRRRANQRAARGNGQSSS
jgi:heme/copper-type cytochrome/quinol oxidase subunit 2